MKRAERGFLAQMLGPRRVLFAIVAIMALLAAAVGYTTVAQRDARRSASASGDVLIALNTVVTDLLNAETGQRGYVLTGDPGYLRPYELARRRIDADMAALERIYTRHPGTHSIAGLGAQVSHKLAELDRTVALVRQGRRGDALDIVGSGDGRRAMDAIRAEVDALSERERASRTAGVARAERAESWLLPLEAVLALAMLALVYAALVAERRRAEAAVLAEQAGALGEANKRSELLLRELNHRVKNVFAVIMSLVGLAARRHPEGRALGDDLRARIHALALAHSASLGEGDVDAVPLRGVLERCLEPYDLSKFELEGEDIVLPVRAVTPIGLVVHELATNALKYGALRGDEGSIRIDWRVTDRPQGGKITLRWIESGMPALSKHPQEDAGGFGTTMMTLASRQLGGTMTRSWRDDGVAIIFEFKLL